MGIHEAGQGSGEGSGEGGVRAAAREEEEENLRGESLKGER